jgi:hypothetical protein
LGFRWSTMLRTGLLVRSALREARTAHPAPAPLPLRRSPVAVAVAAPGMRAGGALAAPPSGGIGKRPCGAERVLLLLLRRRRLLDGYRAQRPPCHTVWLIVEGGVRVRFFFVDT